MAELSLCALSCLDEALANSTCSPSDIPCQCTNEVLVSSTSQCITIACTVKEALSAQNFTSTRCGSPSVVDKSYLVPMSVLLGLAGTAVLLRLIARFSRGMTLWWDDACNIVALLLAGGYHGTVVEGTRLGVGNDIWAIPFDNLYTIFKLVLAEFDLYVTGRFMARCSIILFYIRVFATTHLSKALWITFYVNVAFWFTVFIIAIFQCSPVSYFWTQWDGEHDGWCMSSGIPTWLGTGVGVAEDIWLIGLPLFHLRGLKLSLKKKITTLIMFAVGLLTIGLGIMRMTTQPAFVNAVNLTRDGVPTITWCSLELYTSIFCACLPSVYPLLRPLLSWIGNHVSRSKQAPPSQPSRDEFYRREIAGRKKYKPDWDITLSGLSTNAGGSKTDSRAENTPAPYQRISDLAEGSESGIVLSNVISRSQ